MGSLSTALLICKVLDWPDPREHGSHNPGASNMMRLRGRWAATATLLGDGLKGALPVLLAIRLEAHWSVTALTGVFAVLGHLYPVFFDFRGGKGVATAFGVILTLHLWSGLGVILLWLGVFALTRVASMASLISWTMAPVLFYWLIPQQLSPLLLICALILYRHINNIAALLRGTERRF